MNKIINGKREGIWVGYYSSGIKEYKCIYKNGKLNGEFVHYYPDGSIEYIHNYKDNKLHGNCQNFFENSKGILCSNVYPYKEGVPHGQWRITVGSDTYYDQYFEGKRHGISTGHSFGFGLLYQQYFFHGEPVKNSDEWRELNLKKIHYKNNL